MMRVDFISIKNFLLNKEFNGIFLGQKRDNILELLGSPIDILPQRKKNKEILSYGVLQVYLFDGIVDGFTFDYQKEAYFNNKILYEKVYQIEVLEFLKEQRINYIEDQRLYFQTGNTFVIDSNLYLCFVDDILTIFGLT